jgi:type III restriction enzyme
VKTASSRAAAFASRRKRSRAFRSPATWLGRAGVNNVGRLSLTGPGREDEVSLAEFRSKRRLQELTLDLARSLTRDYLAQARCDVPAHVLFPQLQAICERYVRDFVRVLKPADRKDLFCRSYYAWLVERLVEAIRPDTTQGEAPEVPRYEEGRGPGSTADVELWTTKEVREVHKSHLNYVVADTRRLEEQAAYYLDTNETVEAFVKNQGLTFAIPYLHNGQAHDYIPDFIVRLKTTPPIHLILETKGFDPLEEVKRAAAERWVAAVNADGTYGRWVYAIAKRTMEINGIIEAACSRTG